MSQDMDFVDVLKVQGVNAQGYGTVPKLVMRDRRLTRDAKAIYAYFCSYAGAGNTAFPGVSRICNDLGFGKEETYRKHFRLLKAYGYISVTQTRREDGSFGPNIYELIANPEADPTVPPICGGPLNGAPATKGGNNNIFKKDKKDDDEVLSISVSAGEGKKEKLSEKKQADPEVNSEEKISPNPKKEAGEQEKIRVLAGRLLDQLKIHIESDRQGVMDTIFLAQEKSNATWGEIDRALRNVSELAKRKKIKNLQGLIFDSITKKKIQPISLKKTPMQKKYPDITCQNMTENEAEIDKKYQEIYIT